MNEAKRMDSITFIRSLVDVFEANRAEYIRHDSPFNETQTREDFINPFLRALGWDVDNTRGDPVHLREVFHEATVEVEGDEDAELLTKKPDYAIRVNGRVKFYIEAKKPAVRIGNDKKAAFQLRRYGWTARLPMAILTNFDKLIIYDTRVRPEAQDEPQVSRLKVYNYRDYVSKFDEIYNLISREAVYQGKFDEAFPFEKERIGIEPFDEYFLKQIQQWRERLANDLVQQNGSLTQEEINYLVQRLLNRIIFLRICEDRNLEKYKTLQKVMKYQELKELFLEADKRYNSELFDFVEDKLSLDVEVGSEVLIEIFKALYYPESPYAFSVVDAGILGEIYELFLGKSVSLEPDHTIKVVDKPEVVESGGVVPTPRYIVDAIIQKTLVQVCSGKSPSEIAKLRLADIACGSGTFLLAAFEHLMNYHLEWYLKDGASKHRDKLREDIGNQWNLSLHEKQRILLNNIYGVDIDDQAVEVTRFSLLLRILENETRETVAAHFAKYKERALPNLKDRIKCGNSLVDPKIFQQYDPNGLSSEEDLTKVNPFDWNDEFPDVMAAGGFDVIIGNPPYIRIQNMVKYSPKECKFYQSLASPYTCAKADNFDKYSLFIERALILLNVNGCIGYIVPHKFCKLKSGRALRKLLSSGKYVAEIVHFGVQQVFGKKTTTYTCILILSKAPKERFSVEYVANLTTWRYGRSRTIAHYKSSEIGEEPWSLIPPEAKALFERLKTRNPITLEKVANIFVGVQTSADKITLCSLIQKRLDL